MIAGPAAAVRTRRGRTRCRLAGVLLGLVMAASCGTPAVPGPPHAGPASTTNSPGPCASSRAPAGFTTTVCLTAPGPATVVSGTVPVTPSVTAANAPPINGLTYTVDGRYLLFGAQAPYRFSWHTAWLPPGPHQLAVSVTFSGGYTSAPATEVVTIRPGPAPAPVPPFTPATATGHNSGRNVVVAAVGDGASGMLAEQRVADEIGRWKPDLFFYLGDVYANGSPEEFANWYGDDGAFYSRFRSITDPVIGNHEYATSSGAPYTDYWGGVPHYYGFQAGAWHIITLDDTSEYGQAARDSPQYRWLADDLAHDNARCTMVLWHRPVFSLDSGDPPAAEFSDYWQLLAAHHVTAVLTGHAHNYQRWTPLDGAGDPSPSGVTQIVAGTGGQWISQLSGSDPRLVAHADGGADAWGALRLDLSDTGAGYRFTILNGSVVDQGSIPCRGPAAN